MAFSLGTIFADVDLKTGRLESEGKKAEGLFERLGISAAGVGTQVGKSTGAIGGFVGSLGRGLSVIGLAKMGIDTLVGVVGGLTKGVLAGNIQFEQYEVSFATFLKTTDAYKARTLGMTSDTEKFSVAQDLAKERMEELTEFARKTPFELPQVVAASRTLQVFGGTAYATGENLALIGDAASAVGAPMEEISFWFGRLITSMKNKQPMGEALMRLGELGIITGEVRIELEKLQKSGASLDEMWALVAGSVKENFGGMMEEQSKTLQGMLSNLSDWFFKAKLVLAEPIFDAVKGALGGLLIFLDDSLPTLEIWAGKLESFLDGAESTLSSDILPGLKSSFADFKDFVGNIFEELGRLDLSSLIGALEGLGGPLRTLGSEVLPQVLPLIVELVAAFVSLTNAVTPAIAMGVQGVATAAGGLATALGGLTGFLTAHPDLIRAMVAAWVAWKVVAIASTVAQLAIAIGTTLVSALQTGYLQFLLFRDAAVATDMALTKTILGTLLKLAIAAGAFVVVMKLMGGSAEVETDKLQETGFTVEGLGDQFSEQAERIKGLAEERKSSSEVLTEALKRDLLSRVGFLMDEANTFDDTNNRINSGLSDRAQALYNIGTALFQQAQETGLSESQMAGMVQELDKLGQSEDIVHGFQGAWNQAKLEIQGAASSLEEAQAAFESALPDIAALSQQHLTTVADAVKKVGAGWDDILPKPEQTFGEWQAQLLEFITYSSNFKGNLTTIFESLSAAGIENVDALVSAIGQKGPEYTAAFATMVTEGRVPVEELRTALPLLLGESIDEIINTVIGRSPAFQQSIQTNFIDWLNNNFPELKTVTLAAQESGDWSSVLSSISGDLNLTAEKRDAIIAAAKAGDWATVVSTIETELNNVTRPRTVTVMMTMAPIMTRMPGVIMTVWRGGQYGGFITEPTLLLAGEKNRRELLLPLENEARTRQLLDRAGLLGGAAVLKPAPMSSTAGNIESNVAAAMKPYLKSWERATGTLIDFLSGMTIEMDGEQVARLTSKRMGGGAFMIGRAG